MITVGWRFDPLGVANSVDVADAGELDALLDRIERETSFPLLVTLAAHSGAWLTLGLGAEKSILTVATPDGQSMTCRPHPYAEGQRLTFTFDNQTSEFDAECFVEKDTARAAAREFVETGLPPSIVEWENDW